MIQDVATELSTDLLALQRGDPILSDIARVANPFYDKTTGARLVFLSSTQM